MPSYSRETYDHPNFLVRFPHRRRMELVADLIRSRRPRRWLDFGAGDGALIRYLRDRGDLAETEIVAFEPVPDMFRQLSTNVGHLAGKNLRLVDDLGAVQPADFDLITALEVLEHLHVADRAAFYALVASSAARGCLVEVPVETGPVLALKEFGRVAIKRRRSQFGLRQLAKASLGRGIDDVQGRYDPTGAGYIFTHFGFDLATFEKEMGRIGEWHRSLLCPFPKLPVGLNQCIMYELTVTTNDIDALRAAIVA